MTIDDILAQVAAERAELDGTVRIDWPAERWLAALGERVGGVCQAVVRGGHDDDLRSCLVGVAALCGAWAEAMGEPRRVEFHLRLASRPKPDERWLASLLDDLGQAANRVYVGDGSWWVADALGTVAATAVRWATSIGGDAALAPWRQPKESTP